MKNRRSNVVVALKWSIIVEYNMNFDPAKDLVFLTPQGSVRKRSSSVLKNAVYSYFLRMMSEGINESGKN